MGFPVTCSCRVAHALELVPLATSNLRLGKRCSASVSMINNISPDSKVMHPYEGKGTYERFFKNHTQEDNNKNKRR